MSLLRHASGSAFARTRGMAVHSPALSQALFHSTPSRTENVTAGKGLAGVPAYNPADFAPGETKEFSWLHSFINYFAEAHLHPAMSRIVAQSELI